MAMDEELSLMQASQVISNRDHFIYVEAVGTTMKMVSPEKMHMNHIDTFFFSARIRNYALLHGANPYVKYRLWIPEFRLHGDYLIDMEIFDTLHHFRRSYSIW